jgi:hypothetical protein
MVRRRGSMTTPCHGLHRNERVVVTQSIWPMRQPLYSRPVVHWRHDATHLHLLLEVSSAEEIRQPHEDGCLIGRG